MRKRRLQLILVAIGLALSSLAPGPIAHAQRTAPRGGADQGCVVLLDRSHKVGRRFVDTDIGDLKTVGGEHGPDEGLADLVQVSFHRAEDDPTQHLPLATSHQGGFQDVVSADRHERAAHDDKLCIGKIIF